MRHLVDRYSEVSFVLLVTGAGMTPWPWLALVVAGAYFAVLAYVADQRSATPSPVDEAQP